MYTNKFKSSSANEPIAIVGMGCRFPGHVNDPDTFWELLIQGTNAITDIPPDRWNVEKYYDPDPNRAGKIKTCKGGFVDGFDQFDPGFFGMFPKEAERVDPQQRFLLEVAYEAMQDAGIRLDDISGSRTAVYMGLFMSDYWDLQTASTERTLVTPHVAMGASRTSAANRLSYVYNLKGPSVTMDTACSSSLVAVHQACQSIWSGESSQALAGGVNLMLRPETSLLLSKGNFLSPDGHCKTYDSRANGYVRSEGCGVVILKPLSQAVADGNPIYATIIGSAVNQDGHTEEGFTVPSLTSQVDMLKTAYKNAGVDPKEVVYVEGHGTGTPVGDPIETNAFGEVIGHGRAADKKYWVGSVKTNIGHTEAAAGVAGLIKLALVLKNKKIPQNLHFENPNPKIPFDKYRIQVPIQLTDLPQNGKPAIGGVNSFGAGGTNAHIVMQAYEPGLAPSIPSESQQSINSVTLFTLSAQSKESLKAIAAQYVGFLPNTDATLSDICYTAGLRRSPLDYRLAVAVRTKEELCEKLKAFLQDETRPGMNFQKTKNEHQPKIGFIFSGQGPQWYAMGQQLIQTSEVFRTIIEQIDALFRKVADWSLLEEMNRDETTSRVSETRIAQPAIMAIQIGLTEVWKSWGVMAEGCVGHSIGEVAAAYAAGALTLEQAVEVIYHRSRGQHKATDKGKMLAVALTVDEARKVITGVEDVVSIAAINGPDMLTLSGDVEPLERIAKELEEKDIFHRFLRVNVPFHSHHMEPLKDELIASLTHLVPCKANIPLYSTVTGKNEDGHHLVSGYWYRNVREPVFFTDALAQMARDGFDTFIEIGPHPVLTVGANDLLKAENVKNAFIVPSLRRKEDEALTMMGALGMLYTQGYEINWIQLMGDSQNFVKLPAYVWQHERYWLESEESRKDRLDPEIHPLLGQQTASAVQPSYQVWSVPLNLPSFPYVKDHQVESTIVFPGTGHLEIAFAALRASFPEEKIELEDIHFDKALYLTETEPSEIRLEILDGKYYLCSRTRDDAWVTHSYGKISTIDSSQGTPEAIAIKPLLEKLQKKVSIPDLYLQLKEAGLSYGETFRRVQKIWKGKHELLAAVHGSAHTRFDVDRYHLHPALLDACLHTIFAAREHTDNKPRGIYLPTHIERYTVYGKPSEHVWTYVNIHEASDDFLVGDYQILNESGELVATIEKLTCSYIPGSRGEQHYTLSEGLYDYIWEPIEEEQSDVQEGALVIFSDIPYGNVLSAKSDHISSQQTILIKSGDSFVMTSEQEYIVDPEKEESFDQLFNTLRSQDILIQKVIFYGMEDLLPEEPSFGMLERHQNRLANSLLNLLRSVERNQIPGGVVVVTQGAESPLSPETVDYTQAPMVGISRVFMNEFPYIPMKLVDVPVQPTEAELATLWKYCIQSPQSDTELAIRDTTLYTRKLVRTPEVTSERLALSANATYLITGGASGFGLEIALWLAQQGAEHLVLLSRSGCKTEQDQEKVSQMGTQGVNVHLLNVDITDQTALQKVVQHIDTNLPPLKGIIHSAALIDDQAIPQMSGEVFMKVYRAKALGAWNLHQVTLSHELDFFLMLSSISAVFGFPGQSNYSSANSFLDRLAMHRQSLGLKGSAINLGVLDDYAGMSQDDGRLIQALIHQGWKLLSLKEVTAMLEHVLVTQPTARMTAYLDWKRFKNFYYNLQQDSRFVHLMQLASEGTADSGSLSLTTRWRDLAEAEQVELLATEMTGALGHILGVGIEALDTEVPITKIGLDSLMLNQLRNWIQQALEINYPLMRLAKGPSLRELALDVQNLLVSSHKSTSSTALQAQEGKVTNEVGRIAEDTSGISELEDLELYTQWLVRRKKNNVKEAEPRYRIFCIHPVGAGASMFSYFIFNPPQGAEVLAFQLPGRENRIDEPHYDDINALVADMAQAMLPLLDRPFLVFGHSFGGMISYELIRHLKKYHGKQPMQLFISGTIAPPLTKKWKERDVISETAILTNSEERLLSLMNYIDDVEFLKRILPVMRKDMALIMNYKYVPEEPLKIPISAFAAKQDEVVYPHEVEQWRGLTQSTFNLEMVEGDHWFLSRNRELILQRLTEASQSYEPVN